MAIRYFKHKKLNRVCSVSSGNRSKAIPGMPHNSFEWIEIGKDEFCRLKKRILRGSEELIDTSFVNSSVEDLQSGLYNHDDLRVLRAALKVVTRRGEKTKAAIIKRKIAKLEKEAEKERKLRLMQQAYD